MMIFWLTRILLNSKIILHIISQKFYDGQNVILFSEESGYIYPEGYSLFFLLFINLGLQIFWQIMIFKFAHNLIVGKNPKDEKGNEYFKRE